MRTLSLLALMGVAAAAVWLSAGADTARAAETQVPLQFTDGHELGQNDYGRPVVLIAAPLGVKPDDFRKAFAGVTPSRHGPPSGEQARQNKAALMSVLAPLGVTNHRLDEVSNYYRFQPQRGELWRSTPAQGYAVVENGVLQRVVLTAAGSGYCSLPQVTIPGQTNVTLRAVLHFDREFSKNGSIATIEIIGPPASKQ